jgi:hypothetical protein
VTIPTTTPIGYEAAKAHIDDLQRAAERSRAAAAAGEHARSGRATRGRTRTRAIARRLRLA